MANDKIKQKLSIKRCSAEGKISVSLKCWVPNLFFSQFFCLSVSFRLPKASEKSKISSQTWTMFASDRFRLLWWWKTAKNSRRSRRLHRGSSVSSFPPKTFPEWHVYVMESHLWRFHYQHWFDNNSSSLPVNTHSTPYKLRLISWHQNDLILVSGARTPSIRFVQAQTCDHKAVRL